MTKRNKDKIISVLADSIDTSPEDILELRGDGSLIDIGFTSLKFISFIVRIEEECGIEVLDSDLLFDNFASLDKIFLTLEKYFHGKEIMKKCLILDADGVLWKGISGEDDIIIDEQVKDFQSMLLKLYEHGVLLAVCSKNEEAFIENSLSLPKMLLKKEHFVYIVANRDNKEKNIRTIINKLNLTLDSAVFVDDSDYELGFVSTNLPDVVCVKFDYSDMSVAQEIASLFSNVKNSTELNRTKLYTAQKGREKEKMHFSTLEEYNQSLETVATIKYADADSIPRLAELSSRTHQFNLSARSYAQEEIESLLESNEAKVITIDVSDKYGDMGIIGMAVLKGDTIEAFMLSCRAFDRGFECLLLDAIKAEFRGILKGVYRENGKNDRFQSFYAQNGVVTV